MVAYAPRQVKTALGFQFIALPVEIVQRKDLSFGAKTLVAVVMDAGRGSRSGSCRLANATLAFRIGASIATVKRLLRELEDAGLIRRETAAAGRVRLGIVPTWAAQIATTAQASTVAMQAAGGSEADRQADQVPPTSQTRASDPNQTGAILATLGDEKKPTPAEVAAAMRSMVAGRYSPLCGVMGRSLGDYGAPETPLNVGAMAQRVGYSAVAAAEFPKRPSSPAPRSARANGPQPRRWDGGPIVITGPVRVGGPGISSVTPRRPSIPYPSPDRQSSPRQP